MPNLSTLKQPRQLPRHIFIYIETNALLGPIHPKLAKTCKLVALPEYIHQLEVHSGKDYLQLPYLIFNCPWNTNFTLQYLNENRRICFNIDP